METRELVVLAAWMVVLIVAIALAVMDLRRQTGSTDVWTHVTYRPARRRSRHFRRARRDNAISAMIRDAYIGGVSPDEVERALAALHERMRSTDHP